MVRAARDLYGADSTDCNRTVAAWKAVKVTPAVTCAAVPAPGANFANPGFEQGNDGAWTASPGIDHGHVATASRTPALTRVRWMTATPATTPTACAMRS